jgi:hypothetical protein
MRAESVVDLLRMAETMAIIASGQSLAGIPKQSRPAP